VTRAVPPTEHLDYLQEIGVDIYSPAIFPASPGPLAAPDHVPEPAQRPATPAPVAGTRLRGEAVRPSRVVKTAARVRLSHRSRPRLWWRVLEFLARIGLFLVMVFLFLVLLDARKARSEDESGARASIPATVSSAKEPSAVKKRSTSKSQKVKDSSAHRHDGERDGAAAEHDPAPSAAKEPGIAESGGSSAEPSPSEAPSAARPSPVSPAVPPEASSAVAASTSKADTSAVREPMSPRSQRGSFPGIETVVGIAFLSGLGYLAWDRRNLGSRLGRIEAALEPEAPESSPLADIVSREFLQARLPEPTVVVEVEGPEAALDALIAEAKRRGLPHLPRAAARAWGAGVASIMGNVRRENQDAAIAFEIGSTAVLIVADGLGGLPHGKDAARLAVGAASLSAVEALAMSPAAHPHPELVAEHALLESAAAICRRAMASGWAEQRDGFRTTIIAVVATPATYGYAYLGDGGGIVVRDAGTVEAFLIPQKADGIANVVAGSLGPILQGTPAVGRLPRRGGDSLLIGTDGVFDRVQNDFASSVVHLLASHRGDAQAVASLVVSEFASAKEGSMFVCDDNLSLAILCTPPPRAADKEVTLRRPAVASR
jgi:serine/threonine protein phosphatase PrpC